jgi:hypothetical protein
VINLGESSLVNKVSHTLQVRIAPSNVRLTDSEHVYCGLWRTDEKKKKINYNNLII